MTAAIIASTLTANPGPMWKLSTADTMATIGVVSNMPAISSLRNVEDGHEWCPAPAPLPLLQHVLIGGKSVSVQWRFAGGTLSAAGTLTLRFTNLEPKLVLRSVWQARRGRGPVEHWIEIVNKATSAVTVPRQESLALSGLEPGGHARVWWVRRGAGNALTQGGLFSETVRRGLRVNLVSNNHDGESPVPWLAAQVGKSRGLYVGWEFSGLGRVQATAGSSTRLNLNVGLLDDFETDIGPGETLRIPAAFVGCYRGDLDDGSASLHKFVVEKLLPRRPRGFPAPTLVVNQYLDAGGPKAKEADVLRVVKFAKSIGAECFMNDAMWFPACGDWRWDPARFPKGPKPIVDAVHAAGMKMGLWWAWGNGGISDAPGALSVRGPQGRPDWFEADYAPDWAPGPFYGAQVCLGCEEAKAWEIVKTEAMVGACGIDMLKTDCHPMTVACNKTDHRHRHVTDASYWATLGVYAVWDNLRAKFPNLALENCSGASHIKDYGVVQRNLFTVVTDTLEALPDRAAIWDSTYVLPPLTLMAYTYAPAGEGPAGKPGPYLWRSAMQVSWQLAPMSSATWTPEEKASARDAMRVFKEWIRPIVRDCAVYHVLPRPDGKQWDGMFYWSARLRRGSLFVFRPDSDSERQTIRLRGLDPGRRYRVCGDDGSVEKQVVSGSDLMGKGLEVRLPAKFTSDLIRVQEVRG